MAKNSVKKFGIYRWRFILGYSFIGLVLTAVLLTAALLVPGGITPAEQASALKSGSLTIENPTSFLVTDLPYHALQKASIFLFGLHSISIKLPSLLLAVFAGIGLVLLLRRWFQPSVSVITGSIAVVSMPFIYLAQQGTPAIMAVFWPICILLLTNITSNAKQPRLAAAAVPLLGIAAGLSLYTPLALYLLIAMILAGSLHPHVRHLVKRSVSRAQIGGAIMLTLLCAAPLFYLFYQQPSTLVTLLVSSNDAPFEFLANGKAIALQLFDITGRSMASLGAIAPYFALPTLLLALAGAYSLFKERHGAKNYLLTAWVALLVPVMLLNPHRPELLFVPIMLLVGIGIANVLNYWYRLFPLNPYARVFGLLPIMVLMGGIMLTDSLRYFRTLQYSAPLATNATNDLSTINKHISQTKEAGDTPILAVSHDEEPFYELYNAVEHDSELEIVTEPAKPGDDTVIIATRDSDLANSSQAPTAVFADGRAGQESDRVYLYKKAD